MGETAMAFTKGLVHGLLKGCGTLLYPPHCGACDIRLGEEQEEASLCSSCLSSILPLPEHRCPRCSHNMQGYIQCPNCEGRDWHLSVILAACRYEGLVRQMIQRFKYGRDQSLMRPLGDLMLPTLRELRLSEERIDAIVPVPLHPIKERERGYNQAALLAQRLAWHAKLPVLHLLKRSATDSPQAGRDRKERLKHMEGAFEAKRNIEQGINLLLVDDVLTTGTTLNACARVLRESGVGKIKAITVARG